MPHRTGRATLSGLNMNDLPGPWLRELVKYHLTAEDRLSLLQVNRGTAAVVLQHAPSIELLLEHRSSATAGEMRAQRHGIESILAAAPGAELKVCLKGRSADGEYDASGLASLLSGSIRQHVQQLTFRALIVTADMLQNQLQLQQCHQLHTLVLAHRCGSMLPPQQLAVLAQQRTAIFPPTLHNLQEEHQSRFLSSEMTRIIGPQLTHLKCSHSLDQYPLSSLSQLTHISVQMLNDIAMGCLQALPHLTHVAANYIKLFSCHVSKQLKWHELKIMDGACADYLLPLPVPHITQVVMQGCIMGLDADTVQQATTHLASCPNLQCVPTTEGYHLPGFPQFTIATHPSELVMLCANSMTASGCLGLCDIQFPALQQLLPSIRQLPQKVQMLRVQFGGNPQQLAIEQQWLLLQQILNTLPQHIQHLVIDCYGLDEHHICAYAHAIVGHLQGHQKLVIAFSPARDISDELQALAEAHPGQFSCVRTGY